MARKSFFQGPGITQQLGEELRCRRRLEMCVWTTRSSFLFFYRKKDIRPKGHIAYCLPSASFITNDGRAGLLSNGS